LLSGSDVILRFFFRQSQIRITMKKLLSIPKLFFKV
jgi:hypothetical protein